MNTGVIHALEDSARFGTDEAGNGAHAVPVLADAVDAGSFPRSSFPADAVSCRNDADIRGGISPGHV